MQSDINAYPHRLPSVSFDDQSAAQTAALNAASEARRLAALQALDVLDTAPEVEFDALVRAAALACGVPISLLSLIDAERQWFKANVGLPGVSETGRDISFCNYAIQGEGLFEISDATADERFADNPLVTGDPNIRFYSGAPVRLAGGECVGTLCVIAQEAKSLDDTQRQILSYLAEVAAHALEARHAMHSQREAALALHAAEEQARALNETIFRQRAHDAKIREINAIAQALPQIVWRASADASVEWMSERFAEFTGVPTQDALAFGWDSVVPADDRQKIETHFAQGRRSGTVMSFTHRLWHAQSGRFRQMLVRANPSLDDAQQLVGWIGTLTDIDDERRAVERDHRASEAFQMASLPQTLPSIPGLTFTADYQAAEADWLVGGDWYDAFTLDDGRVVLSVGDVMGTGLDSAVTMAAVRQSIRGAAQIYPEPGAVLDAADRALRNEQPDRIVTALVGIFEPITRILSYASAGHPLPLYQRRDGTIEELPGGGLPLGLRSELPESRETTSIHEIEDGSLLVLYTDGLSEATRDTDVGDDRIRSAIVAAAKAETGNTARFIREFVLHEYPRDDVAILTLATTYDTASEAEDGGVYRWVLRTGDAASAMNSRGRLAGILRQRGATAEDTADAELIYGELLGNIVRHSAAEAEVALDCNNVYPVLHVLDRGPGFGFTARLPRDVMSESGRGLFICAALARDFNVSVRPDGGSHARAVFRFGLKAGSRVPTLVR